MRPEPRKHRKREDQRSAPNLLFDRCSIRCIVSGFSRIRDVNVTQPVRELLSQSRELLKQNASRLNGRLHGVCGSSAGWSPGAGV